jgi:hypothetical protein
MTEESMTQLEEQEKKHNFHFVLARGMKDKLKNLDVFEKSLSFSQTIARILSELAPVIKVEHTWGEQQMSRYAFVSEDPDEVRDHVYTYIDEDVYREMKLIHQDLNSYSMAQILRGFCEFFLELVDLHGKDVFKVLAANYERWKKDAEDCRLTMREKLQHMLRIIPHILGGNGILTIYDRHFSPLYILRL